MCRLTLRIFVKQTQTSFIEEKEEKREDRRERRERRERKEKSAGNEK